MQSTFGTGAISPPTLTTATSSAPSASELALANFSTEFAPPAKVALDSETTAPVPLKMKTPSWTKAQLRQAIKAVITQQLRFTEASAAYNIPKGTLYDNILGKTKRMRGLDVAALTDDEEAVVLEFCCNVSASTYNRRTPRALHEVLQFVETLVRVRNPSFKFDEMSGFRWWWAFCKKHSVLVLNYTSLNGETFVKAGCDQVRGTAARAKVVKRYLRNAKTMQLRLDAHAYVTQMPDGDKPFDFSKRNSAIAPTPAIPTSAPTSSAQMPASLGAAQTSLGPAPTFLGVPPASLGAAPVSLGPALGSLAAAQTPPTSSAGGWNAQQFLSSFGPLNESLFSGAQGPIQDIINSLMKEESVT